MKRLIKLGIMIYLFLFIVGNFGSSERKVRYRGGKVSISTTTSSKSMDGEESEVVINIPMDDLDTEMDTITPDINAQADFHKRELSTQGICSFSIPATLKSSNQLTNNNN